MIFPSIVLTIIAAASATAQPRAASNPVPVAHEPTITSEIFVEKATLSGLFEVEASKLALTRSSNPQVRDFAQRMVTDHNAAGVELTRIVSNKTLSIPLPMLLDADHLAKLKKLQKESDKKFDGAYGLSMSEGHDEAVSVFTLAAAETLVDADLRAYASKTLPTLQSHHELTRKLPLPAKD